MKFSLKTLQDTKATKAYTVGLLQGKAYRALNNHLTVVLFPYNLSIPQWKILGLLSDNDNLKLIEIAKLLDVEAPQVTKLLDQLEIKKLVKKTDDPTDRRAKVVKSTAKGKELIVEIEPKVKGTLKTLTTGMNRLELLTYVRVLEAIVANS